MITTKTREYRSFDFELESVDKSKMIKGIPLTFGKTRMMYEIDGIQYFEVINSGALDHADISDVVLNVDHAGKPAAKTKNGTLILRFDQSNLHMQADLSKNATGRELYEDILNGFYESMSFAFTVEEESYNRETRTRTINKIKKLYDVSAVTVPAFEETSISVRSFFEAEAEKNNMEIEERKRTKLRLRAKYGLNIAEEGN